ncbi:hypothetical protein ACIBCT_29355 [Streptosporangium sp. NPDC050855]|uniref:hypothetical protein n=1 Tax=Streptosporangium sp. NPDC050855 TaxID=3366194 RepID=UPI0037AC3AB8
MIERTDQLVLDYVGKVADAAHGVLPPRQRIDFVTGLRRRIDAERRGTDDPAAVARMLAGLGDPVELVGQELRRLGRQETPRPPGVPAHASSASAPPASAAPSSAAPSSATSAPAASASVPAPASPLAAPTSRDSGDSRDPDDPGEGDDAGVPAPRRPVRGHPYASTPPSDPSASPDRASVPGRRSEDEWDDAVEGDPPTEEIPPVPPVPPTPPAPDPLAPPVPNPVAPPAPDPLAPSVPDPLAPSVPDPLAPSVPDPLAPPVPGPVPQTEPGKEAEPRSKGPGNGDASGKGPAGVRPGMPPGVARGIREAEERLARKQSRARPGLLRRNRPPRSREDIVPGTQDARTILLGHRLETVGMALLTLAGLLIPFPFAPIAIFTVPVLVWAVGAVVVVACQAWLPADKVIGIVSPMLSYTLGGGLVALVRARGDIGRVVEEFFTISGLMFLLGTAWGVFWLTYRLLNPVIQPGRGGR